MENTEKKPKNKKLYKLVLYEEFSLDEIINLKLTKQRLIMYGAALIIVIGFLVGLLFIYTPLSSLLPPIENYKLQQQIITNSQLIDSLKKEVVLRDNYFTSIQNILNEQNVSDFAEIDSSQLNNLLTDKQKDSLINVLVDRDKEYLDQMKQNNTATDYNVKFIQPLSGVITNKFDPAKGHNGIDIVATEGAPIMSVLDGTVVLATWSSSMGNVIAVQHVNNILSVYKHCSKLLKKEGDKVGVGDAIALVGNTGEASTGPHLHFELWIDGKAVNPQNYISF